MPTSVGPNTYGEENLVFGYDLGDVVNSYKGEPTTNIVPSPQNNSRFTTSNTWYTYNTAQYNGAQYFSIGTIGSVTNNEVTLSSVSRTLYDYDVLTPQTTGGGVTSGTNYFVKKTGANSFTLHAYNSSENGLDGYRNPSTGQFKVHDSIALDQRISINSTNFPTMWWGPPHTPNMCYVKEVVASGGPNDNSSFMRIHLTRPAVTDGGMAYGVYPSVTQGDVITVSFWARSIVNSDWSWSTYFNAGYSAPSFSISTTTEWKRFQYTWTASNTFGFYMYFLPGNPGFVPYHVDLADLQVEVNRGHATPFTLSSRSNTQGLIDLTGNSTIDLTNVSFDSKAVPDWDGTSDYIKSTTPSDFRMGTSSFTLEAVAKQDVNTGHVLLEARGNNLIGYLWVVNHGTTGRMSFFYNDDSNQNIHYQTGDFNVSLTGVYYHLAVKVDRNENNIYFYINGEQAGNAVALQHTNSISPSSSDYYHVGWDRGGSPWNGQIAMFKHYNRALSASEIKANYNAIKGRFNI